jgi:plastocyanin
MTRIAILTATFLALILGVGQYVTLRGQAPDKHLSSVHGAVGQSDTLAVDSDSNAGTNGITIDNFSFTPAALTIPAGTTVTWTNRDDIPHTVVQRDQKFKSKALDTDDTFSFTFAEPGTYEYFCSLHPKMVAKIIVEDKK